MSNLIPIKIAELALDAKDKEIALLKAEVERLTNNCDYLDQKLDEELDKSAMLCGQVERLTKAGDAMAMAINLDDDVFDNHEKKLAQSAWNAAKEGKQP
jgi:hypothetical protein